MSESVRAACERLWRAGFTLHAISRAVGLPEEEIFLVVAGIPAEVITA